MAIQRIGRYEILEEIAAGGFATVYRARDTELGRVVALKVLHPHMARDPQYVERFLREARMAASISHSNVVTIHEVGREGNSHFIAMEYLPSSLEDRLRRGRMPVPEALGIARQVALALQAAHQQGVVHRDLKPQNIMFTQDGTIRVTDFGIARAAELSTMTASGMVLGTPSYMSPEQAQGQRVDARSDIYPLGCVLYQMLTGTLPFQSSTTWEVIRQHIEAAPRQLRQLRADVPAAVEQLASRCLEKDPNRRYQTAGELAAAIDRLLVTVEGTGKNTSGVGVTPALGPSGLSRTGQRISLTRKAVGLESRWWWLAGLTGVAILAVAGLLAGQAIGQSVELDHSSGSAGGGTQQGGSLTLTPELPLTDPAGLVAEQTGQSVEPDQSSRSSRGGTQGGGNLAPPDMPLSGPLEAVLINEWGSLGSGDGQFRSPGE
jgi:tRNA A-37 threonylcarbamoyl transferase component Bud32